MIFGPASIIGGGSITTERERMAAQVFQPSHRYVLSKDASTSFYLQNSIIQEKKESLPICKDGFGGKESERKMPFIYNRG